MGYNSVPDIISLSSFV